MKKVLLIIIAIIFISGCQSKKTIDSIDTLNKEISIEQLEGCYFTDVISTFQATGKKISEVEGNDLYNFSKDYVEVCIPNYLDHKYECNKKEYLLIDNILYLDDTDNDKKLNSGYQILYAKDNYTYKIVMKKNTGDLVTFYYLTKVECNK